MLQSPFFRTVRNSVRCTCQGMCHRRFRLFGLLTCAAILPSIWWGNRRLTRNRAIAPANRSASTSTTVCMAVAMSESNPITVGNLEVQRIPCLSVSYTSCSQTLAQCQQAASPHWHVIIVKLCHRHAGQLCMAVEREKEWQGCCCRPFRV